MALIRLPYWDPKDPTDVADYWFDWGSDLIPEDERFLPADVTITGHTLVVPAGLLNVAESHTTKMVRVRLGLGTAESDYKIDCTINCDTGEVFNASRTLEVRERVSG